MRVGLAVGLLVSVTACESEANYPSTPPRQGVSLALRTQVPDLRVERTVLAIDGSPQPSNAYFGSLPAGDHQVTAAMEASYPCGVSDEPRGLVQIRGERVFRVGDAPAGRVRVTFRERDATSSWREQLDMDWSFSGSGVTEGSPEGCALGGERYVREVRACPGEGDARDVEERGSPKPRDPTKPFGP